MSRPSPERDVTALVISGASSFVALDLRDTTAGSAPWAVVVRRVDGSLGRHGAVVTFPVSETGAGRQVKVGGASGRAGAGDVNWAIAGAHARVRGDLGEAALLAIATNTRVVGNRPVLHPPAGYTIAGSGPYRPPHIREARYNGEQVSSTPSLAGLIYTGVVNGGGFEDQLYASSGVICGTVHGQPAVVSMVLGGNGTLAWQAAPGLVAYVGYSGRDLTGDVLGAVRRLAERTRPLDEQQWHATRPFVIDQRNDIG